MKRDRKDYLNRLYHYSIRKTSLGVGSVVVGLFLSGVLPQETVLAETPVSPVAGQTDKQEDEQSVANEAPVKPLVEEGKSSEVAEQGLSSSSDAEKVTSEAPAEDLSRVTVSSSPAVANVATRSAEPSSDKPSETITQTESPEEWHKVNHYNDTDKVVNFDKDWKFNLGDSAAASSKSFDDSSWKKLDLPHDFSLTQDYTPSGEAESGYKPGGIGWYRKSFTIGEEAAKGRVNLQFDGAYMETEVFINGTSLGTHTYGYSPFSFDLTEHLKKDEENVLAVKVTNPIPSSRWYSGSGIYRSVHLEFAPSVHLAEYGVVVRTPDLETTHDQASGSRVTIGTSVINQGNETAQISVKHTLFERQGDGSLGTTVAETQTTSPQTVAAGARSAIDNSLTVIKPKLWSVDNPHLYVLRTEVLKDGQVIQSRDQETGFRYTAFDKDTGFKLNGQNLKLQGVSMHHDQGGLGARAYYDAIERQFTILKDMGVNAVRVTHNPASRAMKDIANRKGMLLIDEAFDTWEHAKNGNTNDYARFFNRQIGTSVRNLNGVTSPEQTWAEYHIKQMVKSGINDPSIIMWSTGNEVMEGFSANTSNYPQVIAKLFSWVEEIDPTRPATLGDNKLKNLNQTSIAMANALTNKSGTKGIVGYNYANGAQYDQGHRDHPDWIIYGSETASAINSRGVYNVKGNERRSDRQLTSYDQSKVGWGHVASEAWYDTIKRDFVAGEFVWTGFDYLGEPTPWNGVSSGSVGAWGAPKSSYFGIVDTAGLPKDSYYFYRSQWQKGDTTLHVLPAWEESVVKKDANNNVEVVVYSNADKVKLIHIDPDGRETDLGTKELTTERTAAGYTYKIYKGADKQREEHRNLYLTWQVAYRPGTIKAIAYDSQNREITRTIGNKEVKTFTAATQLTSQITKKDERVDSHDLAYVEIDVKDASGNLVVNATNRVTVTVEGPAELVAMDNGNPVDHQSYQDDNRQAFGGKVVAILKMTGKTGDVRVTASADGLTSSTQTFHVTAKEHQASENVDSYKLSKTIYIKKGAALTLPDKAMVRYQDGREVEKHLTFNSSDIAEKLSSGRNFTAVGQVEGLPSVVEVIVSIIDQVAVMKNVSTAVELGGVPQLPDAVQAYLADGSLLSSTFPVTWHLPEEEQFNQEGIVYVEGLANVLGEERRVYASVRVGTKTIAIDQNVAPVAASLTQDINGSDTLEAIRDRQLTVSANMNGGPNPTIWSNYAAAQAGQKTATLTFVYDTAQNISEVVAYYHRDRTSLRPPKTVNFAWSRGVGEEVQAIAATATSPETVNGLTKITYRLERPVPAVEFKITVENADETIGSRKSSVGIAELEIYTALEQFNLHSDASINEIHLGDQVHTGNRIRTEMRLPDTGDFFARHTSNNPAVTVLPISETELRIFTESEDKTRSAVYTVHLIPESPRTPEDKRYVPRSEVTLTAGSVENRASEAVTNANDFDFSTHWHSAWGAGTDISNLWLVGDTGKIRYLDGLAYLQRQDGASNGKVSNYEVYVSTDNQTWESVATGTFSNTNDWQEVSFAPKQARYVKLQAVNTLGDRPNRFMAVSEFRVREVTDPEAKIALTDGHVSLSHQSVTHTGQVLTPQAVVTVAGQVLVENTNYRLTYADNIGQANRQTQGTVTVTGLGRYEGIVTKSFTILPSQVSEVVTDGTEELPDSWTAPTTVDVTAALTDPAYLTKTYTVFPTPQQVTYGDGLMRLDGAVNLVIGSGVDIYTRNRLKETLQANNISYSTSQAAVDSATNIFLGIHGQETAASRHQAGSAISPELYNKIDAHSLVIKGNSISVVGKDTDAVFHGLTTLKHMLKDSEKPVLRYVTVQDYADIKNRGFIEGYYGNPWSNADRAELMRYGGDLKLTQYFFAPKDDPYHNSRWRELYPEEKLAEIKELARAGNQSKTRYVWTLHPFMHNRVRFDNDSVYQEDLTVIKSKFTQLMDVGVREFGILADDAPRPAGGYDSYNRLMRDLTDWLTEKQATYNGLRKEMVFVPHEYWGNGREAELRSLNANLPETSALTLTGGRIWGEVSSAFLNNLKTNLEAGGSAYRPVQLWINWPTTDNSKQHLILGGGEKFLHPSIDPSLIAGIMLNPMQQSEPSKIALFNAAEYTWKVWGSESQAKSVNDVAFNFAETGTFKDSETSRAFRELGKHMINQNMDSRVVKLEESVELAPKLTAFINKLKAGDDVTAERSELRQEFAKLKTAAEVYKTSGHERMKDQISHWLDNTIDQMTALDSLLTATEHLNGDKATLWDNYKAGLDRYNQSKTHTFWYVNHYEAAELGVQHIRPFILNLFEHVAGQIEQALDPSVIQTSLITNRNLAQGDLSKLTDGDLTTQVLSQSPNRIAVGDYVGLAFNRPIELTSLGFAMGATSNLRDTFAAADVQYLNEQDTWVKLDSPAYVGNENQLTFTDLAIKAKAVRIIATAPKENTWLGVREIAINRPLEQGQRSNQLTGTITTSSNLIYKYSTSQDQALDNNPATEAMFANSNGQDNTPADSWVQLNLEQATPLSKVIIVQGTGDKIGRGVVEYSPDGQTWHRLADVDGDTTINIPTAVTAKAVRIKNAQAMNKWWRIAEFKLESNEGVADYTETSVAELADARTVLGQDSYRLALPADATLKPSDYIGLKLARLHQLESIALTGASNDQLSLLYSPNGVEWYRNDQINRQDLVRYVRLINETSSNQSITAQALVVKTKEILPDSLTSTTMGIHSTYGSSDVRNRNNLAELFDGKLNNFVEFSDYPRSGGNIVLTLGSERPVRKIRAYIQDGTQNYLRDGKIQISPDGQTWTDVVTVGDGQENPRRDDSLTDGWTHDSTQPGNRYIEGSLTTPVTAKYLRVLFTADYTHRFVGFTELVINDGEFVKTVNDPTVVTSGAETQDSLATHVVDGRLLTSYRTQGQAGELTYHLSENTHHNHVTILLTLADGQVVTVKARVVEEIAEQHDRDVVSKWIVLGQLDSSFKTLIVPEGVKHLLDIKLEHSDQAFEVYELATYYEEVDQSTQAPDDETPETDKDQGNSDSGNPSGDAGQNPGTPGDSTDSNTTPGGDQANGDSQDSSDSDSPSGDAGQDSGATDDSAGTTPAPGDDQNNGGSQGDNADNDSGDNTDTNQGDNTTTPDTIQPPRQITDVNPQTDSGIIAEVQTADAKVAGLRVVFHKETNNPETPVILKGTDYDLFDIELVDKDGNVIKPAAPVDVYLPIDDGKDVAQVVYLPNSDQSQSLSFTTVTRDGKRYAKFTAEHFSEYGIVYEPQSTPVPPTSDSTPNPVPTPGTPGQGADTSNPGNPGIDQGGNTPDTGNTPNKPVDKAKLATDLLKAIDASNLTDEQKGDLAVKVAFAETEAELEAIKAEVAKLVKATSQSSAPVASALASATVGKKGLPATGDVHTALAAVGATALLSALGLAGLRRRAR
ncbi:beta-N-acetylglucosaminidase domain-containing protein [Streptococcus sp. E24BD]|uniref:beta-N-acetylglucosaminidase domain-containing protein n=1 Tax=Streptococcus sp. E24BD TaxID=3278715 RepID=UPI00359EB225